MAEGTGGFDGALKSLGEVKQQSKWINEQSSAGNLRLDPEAAEKAAKVCEDEAEELWNMSQRAQAIERAEGLGSYPDGQALKTRFEQKASDPDAGAVPLLAEMQKELQNLADSFRQAAKDYRTTDEQSADDFERGMRQ